MWGPYYIVPPSTIGLQNKVGLIKIPKVGDLKSDKTFRLWQIIPSSSKQTSKVGKHQTTYFHVLLKVMQKVQRVWFRKEVALMPKVGIMLTWSKMTICILWLFLFFSLHFPFHCSVCLWTKDYCFGFKVISHNSNTHSLKNNMHMRFKMQVFVDFNFWANGTWYISIKYFWGVTNLPPLNKISSRDLKKTRN